MKTLTVRRLDRELTRMLKHQVFDPMWSDAVAATGSCGDAAYGAYDWMHRNGYRSARVWEFSGARNPDRMNEYHHHLSVVVEGVVIDPTARQFWTTAKFPVIEPLCIYRHRFYDGARDITDLEDE